jgi:hypothetical protein
MRYKFVIPIVAVVLAGFAGVHLAQPGVATCSPLVDDALQNLGNNCNGLDRNSACYGNTLVQAALAADADEDLFNRPRDRAELVQVSSLRTAPLDEDEAIWGIAMLNTQANLPGTLPGQGVVMMLMGDGEITNTVNPADLPDLNPTPGIVNDNGVESVRVRTGAEFGFNVNSVLAPGTVIAVDARNDDGTWVRVNSGNSFGWMFAELVTLTESSVDALPVLEDQIQSPMQAFYFRSGVGNADCAEAPNALMIQSPRGGQVSLTVNESEIVIGSTVVIETLNDNTMIIYVIDGEAIVNNLVVPAGFKAFAPIVIRDDLIEALRGQDFEIVTIANEGVPAITGPWETCDPISDEDRAWLSTLTDIPENLLNYPVEQAPESDALCASPEEVQVVQEQAFIAQQEAEQPVECTGFVATSPLGGMDWGDQAFYWDPAIGADGGYELRVFDETGSQVVAETTNDTTITVNTGRGNISGGVNYTWDVVALDADGNPVCTTPPVTVPRGAQVKQELPPPDEDDLNPPPPDEPPPPPPSEEEEYYEEFPEFPEEPQPCPPAC